MAEKRERIRIENIKDTTANWERANPILLNGEIGIEAKPNKQVAIKIGDGITHWKELDYVNSLTVKEIEMLLEKKVDKIEGMGLSQNNYSDEEKAKLAALGNGVNFKGHLDSTEQLPSTATVGDMYFVSGENSTTLCCVYSEKNEWEMFTVFSVDLSDYIKWDNLDSELSEASENPVMNKAVALKINAVLEALDTIYTKTETDTKISNSLTTFENIKLKPIENKVDRNTQLIANNSGGISALDTRVTDVENEVNGLNSAVEYMSEHKVSTTVVAALEKKVEDNGTDIDEIQSAMAALQGTVNTNTTNIGKNANEISILNSNVSNLQTGLSATVSRVTDVENEVDGLDSAVKYMSEHKASTTDVTANTNAISALDTRVTSAESKISALNITDTKHSNQITQNAMNIANNTAKIEQIKTNVTASGTIVRLDNLQGEVPFSEISLNGNETVGKQVDLRLYGKNILNPIQNGQLCYLCTTTKNGNSYTMTSDGTSYRCWDNNIGSWLSDDYNLALVNNTPVVGGKTYTLSFNIDNLTSTASSFGVIVWFSMHTSTGQVINRFDIACNETGAYSYSVNTTNDTCYIGVSFTLRNSDYTSTDVMSVTYSNVQVELGDIATEFEEYKCQPIILSPTATPYVVSENIEQYNGTNTLMVSAGEISVMGVNKNSAIDKIWDNIEKKLDISSKNYIPIRYVSGRKNFNTDFMLYSTDPDKVIFSNSDRVIQDNAPFDSFTYPYILTVEKMKYGNFADDYDLRLTCIVIKYGGSDSVEFLEYQRIYKGLSALWTKWKESGQTALNKFTTQSLLYSNTTGGSSPLTVTVSNLFTNYSVIICNIVTSNGKYSLTLPLQYIKSLGTSDYYAADELLFYYVDDSNIKISTGLAQSNPTINSIKIISLY